MTQTYSVLAPSATVPIEVRNGTIYTPDAFGLITGVAQGDLKDILTNGCILLGAGTLNDAAAWNRNAAAPQVLACAGATQGNAAAITQNIVFLSTTTSAEGAALKAVATGAVTEGYIRGTHAFKLYPPANGKFDSVTTTNEAKLITANTGFRVMQRSATAYAIEFI